MISRIFVGMSDSARLRRRTSIERETTRVSCVEEYRTPKCGEESDALREGRIDSESRTVRRYVLSWRATAASAVYTDWLIGQRKID